MDCTNARILLFFARPGCDEFADDERASLHDHLEQCSECRTVAHREKQVDDVLARSMRQVPMPVGLHDRILSRLALERPPRPWVKYVAAAAVLLLSLGLWIGWTVAPRTLTADDLAQVGPRSSADVMSWFERKGLKVEEPPGFDFAYLDSWEVASLRGRRVPKLLFLERGAVAHVYVVPADAFQLAEELTENSGEYAIEHRPSSSGDFVFLVIYSAGSRDSFSRRGA